MHEEGAVFRIPAINSSRVASRLAMSPLGLRAVSNSFYVFKASLNASEIGSGIASISQTHNTPKTAIKNATTMQILHQVKMRPHRTRAALARRAAATAHRRLLWLSSTTFVIPLSLFFTIQEAPTRGHFLGDRLLDAAALVLGDAVALHSSSIFRQK
jgi:hypothetical protein